MPLNLFEIVFDFQERTVKIFFREFFKNHPPHAMVYKMKKFAISEVEN